mgnify:CR=1 FL=1
MHALDTVFQRQAIRRHFSGAAGTYLAAAALQKEVEARLLEQADVLENPPQRILDLGCGPGDIRDLAHQRGENEGCAEIGHGAGFGAVQYATSTVIVSA